MIDKAIFRDLEVSIVESSSSTLVRERNPRISVYEGMLSETPSRYCITSIYRSWSINGRVARKNLLFSTVFLNSGIRADIYVVCMYE